VNPGGGQVNNVRCRIRWLLPERTMRTVAVVVRGVLVEDRRQWRSPAMSVRSVHSRRTVPTQRLANAFARGACGGVLITSMSAAVNTASKTAVNLVSVCHEHGKEFDVGRAT
jgi:hypothetical protein